MKYPIILFIILITTVSGYCQSPWLAPNNSNLAQIEWQKPNFNLNPNSDEGISTLSSIAFLTGKFRLNDKFNVIVEIPLSHTEIDDPSGFNQRDAHTTIGNIYVGTELLFNDNSNQLDVAGQLGIRIPTLPEPFFPDNSGFFTGLVASPDRREAFRDDYIPIYLNGSILIEPESNIEILLCAGGLYSIYTGEFDDFLDNEVHFLYSAIITYSSFLDGSIGFSGRTNISDQPDFNDFGGTSSQLWVVLERQLKQWTPGLYLRTHLDEQNQAVTYVIGAQAKIGF